jgi:hypothetical protein
MNGRRRKNGSTGSKRNKHGWNRRGDTGEVTQTAFERSVREGRI